MFVLFMLFCSWFLQHVLIMSPGNQQWLNEVVASEHLVLFAGKQTNKQTTFVLTVDPPNAYGLFK